MRNTHDKRRLPSLRSLQVFERAAHHGSFTGAAEELGVSQGAVSRQVQELECWLDQELFRRSGPILKLTSTGKTLGEEIGRAMEILHSAIQSAQPATDARHVTLSMLPSVAAKWLAPRLGRFVQSNPLIDLRVTASRHLVDFAAEGVDAAIRYGKGNWPGLVAELLAEETIAPVCTRDYAARIGLKTPADLSKATLLHSDAEEGWAAWFRAAGLESIPVPRGPRLGDEAATLQAVLDGQGIALGRSVLVADDINTGRLFVPFGIELQASYSYWFVAPANATAPADLHAVRDWLKKEFHK